MLPARVRLRRREDFTRALRLGRRAGRPTVLGHLYLGPAPVEPTGTAGVPGPATAASARVTPVAPARVGFLVSRAVGDAVSRNRVRRRLRHIVRDRLPRLERLPRGSLLVLRAQPPAAGSSAAALAADVDRVLERLLSRGGRR